MSAGHDHGISTISHEGPLRWALGLTALFLVTEVAGAFWTHSLALLSDAAHMSTDVVALVIALVSVRLSRRPSDSKRTFGYVRTESMGALANGLMLFVLAAYILWEAIGRFRHPPTISSVPMLVIAIIGLVVNLISMRLLKAGSGESLNMKGAYLEVWSDMLGSLAVIGGAVVIKLTQWTWVDPLLAVLIGLWVLPRTFNLVRDAVNVLMMGVPSGMNADRGRSALLNVPRVLDIHDLHVWALASKEPSLTVHVVRERDADDLAVRALVRRLLHDDFGIEHTTVQVETPDEVGACKHLHA